MSEEARRMMALFSGSEEAHGTHGVPRRTPHGQKWEIKNTAKTLRGGPTEEMWVEHLAGRTPLGVIPITRDSTCRWASMDVDDYDINHAEAATRIDKAGLPLVPCRSKSGGIHFWLFLTKPQPADAVQAALRNVAAGLGWGGCEIFPKQTNILHERGDWGNWMVMPYYGDTYGGKLRTQVGIKKTGAEMTLREFLSTAEKSRVTEKQLADLGEKRAAGTRGGKTVSRSAGAFSDGPPCLQHMAAGGFPEGGRNNALFMVGLYLKRAHPADWQALLDDANREHMKPPLDSEEVMSCVRQLEKREYQYTCKTEPMASHCDAARCRSRKYGVGSGGTPVISGLTKLDMEPAIWFVDVEDKRLELSTLELQNYVLFHRACMERLNKCFQTMTQRDWLAVLADAMETATVQEAPPDAAIGGKFLELLEEFLTGRQRGRRLEDLLLGKPFEDEELRRHYFQLKAFEQFLERQNVRNYQRNQLTRRIAALGGEPHFRNVAGFGRNLWWVPSDRIAGAEEISVPRIEGDGV